METDGFSDRLRRLMESRGLSQAALIQQAADAGYVLGRSQVSQYVSGKVVPRREALEALAAALGVSPEELSRVNQATVGGKRTSEYDREGAAMRELRKSRKLDNVLYDVRGPVVEEAERMERAGASILKLNIGNPAPFGFRAPDEVVFDMAEQLVDCEGYSSSKGLFSARKAIMQYCSA